MKKIYESPAIEQQYVETMDMIANSLPLNTDEVNPEDVLGREVFGVFPENPFILD